jgi:hypothetical protein
MNLVMQLRKVCNHPELLRPKETQSPLFLTSPTLMTASTLSVSISGINTMVPTFYKEILSSNTSPISYTLPKLIYDECYDISVQPHKYPMSTQNRLNLYNVLSAHNFYLQTYSSTPLSSSTFTPNPFSIFSLFGLSLSNSEYILKADSFLSTLCMIHYISQLHSKHIAIFFFSLHPLF